eukprot:jgi/Bigna1/90385/estExt_fgenesh1_pg.C_690023
MVAKVIFIWAERDKIPSSLSKLSSRKYSNWLKLLAIVCFGEVGTKERCHTQFDHENKRIVDDAVISTASISRESSISSSGSASTSSSPSATMTASKNSILRVRKEHKMKEDFEREERAEFKAAWRGIIWSTFKNPINFLFAGQGEFVSFSKDSSMHHPDGNSTWMLSWDFLSNIGRSDSILRKAGHENIMIVKRGHTIAELLRRSLRDLTHKKYLNTIVQELYDHLSPSLKLKTDRQW